MKGVTEIRVKFRAHAYCLEEDPEKATGCGWDEWAGFRADSTVRADARQHVMTTGHQVFVDVVDRTSYEREAAP